MSIIEKKREKKSILKFFKINSKKLKNFYDFFEKNVDFSLFLSYIIIHMPGVCAGNKYMPHNRKIPKTDTACGTFGLKTTDAWKILVMHGVRLT